MPDPRGHVTLYNRLAVEKPQSPKLTKSLKGFGASGPLLVPGTLWEKSIIHSITGNLLWTAQPLS
jgi:hypothetical protein